MAQYAQYLAVSSETPWKRRHTACWKKDNPITGPLRVNFSFFESLGPKVREEPEERALLRRDGTAFIRCKYETNFLI